MFEQASRLPAWVRMILVRASLGRVNAHRFYPAFRRHRAWPVGEGAPSPTAIGSARVAIVTHAFHLDIVEEVVRRLPFFDAATELVFTTDTDEKKVRILSMLPPPIGERTRVLVCENRGRDIAPKLAALATIAGEYELVLFLHSKKSVYFGAGDEWRLSMMDTLAGSKAVVNSIVALFGSMPDLGLAFPQHFVAVEDRLGWGGNKVIAGALARRMGISLERCSALDFPSGSMFWVRPAALRPLTDLRLQPGDFAEEAGQLDGTLAHAIERMFLYAVERAGFRWTPIRRGDAADASAAAVRRRRHGLPVRSLTGRHGLCQAPEQPVRDTRR